MLVLVVKVREKVKQSKAMWNQCAMMYYHTGFCLTRSHKDTWLVAFSSCYLALRTESFAKRKQALRSPWGRERKQKELMYLTPSLSHWSRFTSQRASSSNFQDFHVSQKVEGKIAQAACWSRKKMKEHVRIWKAIWDLCLHKDRDTVIYVVFSCAQTVRFHV